ncbi:rhodanese-like domain-containing protein [Apibacter sp. HY039]|uniref:rhodanese-like domain-containing protein n=1 Tax=Apibacter sp. HY039 TaxID=2501476 RepID=UPI000FEC1EEB|nr:rhodanese-like domain-containing protein [Apibacter sp. HY039]
MKNLFFILFSLLFLLLSCKSGNLGHTNNTVYDTPPEIGRLTTDIPRYTVNSPANSESKKPTSDKDGQKKQSSDVKKLQPKKEKAVSSQKNKKSPLTYSEKTKKKSELTDNRFIEKPSRTDSHITKKTNRINSDSVSKLKEPKQKENKKVYSSEASRKGNKPVKKTDLSNKTYENTQLSSASSLSEDSLKIIAYKKILSKKMANLTINNEKYIRAKAILDKNPKSKLALSNYNLNKKNLENDILDKKVIEDQLFKLTRKRNKVMATPKTESITNIQTNPLPENVDISEEKSTSIETVTEEMTKDVTSTENTSSDENEEIGTPEFAISEEKTTEAPKTVEVFESKPLENEEEFLDTEAISAIRNLNTADFSWEVGIKLTQIVDVRSLDEFKQGHIYDAVNMDINSSNFKLQIHSLDKNHPVAVYSEDGVRSLEAAKILEEAGFTIIYNLQPGLIQWINEKRDIFK